MGRARRPAPSQRAGAGRRRIPAAAGGLDPGLAERLGRSGLPAGAVARVPDAPVEAARTMGASNEEIIKYVLIPAARPAILGTLRETMSLAWTYLVVAELVAASSGLGFAILKAQRFLQTDRIFA